MINGTSAIKGASLSLCFSVGAVLFSSHAGGGFATGNQENVYFISLGWLGPITAIVTMLLFTLTIKEAMNMYNSRHLTSYKQLFQNLYRPVPGIEFLFEGFFYIMVLMAVSATISGAASALAAQTGLNYYTGIGVVGAIIFILTIFGADLVRRATTYMGIAILAMAITIFSVGIAMGGQVEGTRFFLDAMAQDFCGQRVQQTAHGHSPRLHLFRLPVRGHPHHDRGGHPSGDPEELRRLHVDVLCHERHGPHHGRLHAAGLDRHLR